MYIHAVYLTAHVGFIILSTSVRSFSSTLANDVSGVSSTLGPEVGGAKYEVVSVLDQSGMGMRRALAP